MDGLEEVRVAMQEAVADGPNHWPAATLQEAAPWETKLWMEKGAEELSAKRERMVASEWWPLDGCAGGDCSCSESGDGGCCGVLDAEDGSLRGLRQSRPRWSMMRALASRD